MKTYILEAPLTPPKDASDAPERLAALIKACSEIIADSKITAEEAAALRRWLQAAGWLKKFWPANAIAARINRLLEPLPTAEQLSDLGNFLGQVTEAQTVANSYEDCNEDGAERPKLFDDPVPEIVFFGRKFCLSGILRRAMSGSTHYLIVGGICNPQWKQAEAGTKIDSAVAFRSENTQWNIDLPRQPRIVPAIVRERDWVEALIGT
jgi:hypothetical protein